VSRRRRAIGFAVLALVCAGIAAAVAGGYRSGVEAQLGPLRPVVIARAGIDPRQPLRASDSRLLEVRRVPSRFAPPDGLASPEEALGREATAAIPAGAYVTASQLRLPRDDVGARHDVGDHDGEAVEVAVTGVDALAASGSDPVGTRVDVVVTTEPRGTATGRTYVAVRGARLLALREAGPADEVDAIGPAGPAPLVATLGCCRAEALRLIQAHNYARELRLIAAPERGPRSG
jgi:Flp pilus assembly protein CpaB